MNEVYEKAFNDELEKIAKDKDASSRKRSAAKGALIGGLSGGALLGATTGALNFLGSKGKKFKMSPNYRPSNLARYISKGKDTVRVDLALKSGVAGGVVGGTGGAAVGGYRGYKKKK